jgi:hypothetical protein
MGFWRSIIDCEFTWLGLPQPDLDIPSLLAHLKENLLHLFSSLSGKDLEEQGSQDF